MFFLNLLKKINNEILKVENESHRLKLFVRDLSFSQNHKILDVGCGYGKNLVLLTEMGLDVLGVEINDLIVAKNRENGLPCITVNELDAIEEKYDLILMSHIIEHLRPSDLITFMDSYLDKLNIGGFLIIATPLFSPYFYDDFDHIKPYHPTGINMVFGSSDSQVQFYSRNKLKVEKIWFRTDPFKIVFARNKYISKLFNIFFALIFKASFGLIGRTDGWIGLYQKV